MLVHITTQLERDPADVRWLDGELVRRGAWDAHFTAEGGITIAVTAASRAEARCIVDKLLAQALPDAPEATA